MTDPDQLRERVDRLEKRVTELEERLAAHGGNPSPTIKRDLDSRDAAVVAELQHGERYTTNQLRQAYIRFSDVRQNATAKRRVQALTKRDFLKADNNGWIFRG